MFLWMLPLVAACGSGEGRRGGNAGTDAFKVALLTPGPISDQSWNAGAYRGLLAIRDSLGAHVSHIQTRTPAEFEENFRQYGAQGYDLVFGHGHEFQDAAVRVAPEHPATIYVTTSGDRTARNVAGVEFEFEDPSYLAGIVAGAVTRMGVIGVIGGTEIPPVRTSFAAFAAGARSVRPDVRILTSYLGNWEDVGAGKEQAIAQIERGADVIFQNADAAGFGIFQAARDAAAKRVYVFGSNSDQNEVAPDVVIASVVIDLPRALLHIARDVRAGGFTGRVVTFGAESGVVRLVLNPRLADAIPPAARRAVDSVQTRLAAGEFDPLADTSGVARPAAAGAR